MADLCHAFSRIVPKYEFSCNTAQIYVEDLEHTLHRKQEIGYPSRKIHPMNQVRSRVSHGSKYCSSQRCICSQR